MMRAISVDDDVINLILIEEYAKALDLTVEGFTDPVAALEAARENPPDLMLTDYMMPELNGLEFIHRFRSFNKFTPVIMITAAGDDREIKLEALGAGATDFLAKPLDPFEFRVRATNLLQLKSYQNMINDRAALLEHEVRKATIDIEERERETLLLLGRTSETKDSDTGTHIARMAHYSRLVGEGYGLTPDECELLFYSAPLHDLGKIGIPDAILLKPGRLTPEEFDKMKEHTIIGAHILENSESRYLRVGRDISLSHHERFDGGGYPYNLAGEDIPLYGRIVAIADVFDALVSARPYKPGWPVDKAFALIEEEAGRHFDPKLAKIFLERRAEIEEIQHNMG